MASAKTSSVSAAGPSKTSRRASSLAALADNDDEPINVTVVAGGEAAQGDGVIDVDAAALCEESSSSPAEDEAGAGAGDDTLELIAKFTKEVSEHHATITSSSKAIVALSKSLGKLLATRYKAASKSAAKAAQRGGGGKAKAQKTGSSGTSGFARQCYVSPEMTAFVGKDALSRTEVTNAIHNYVKVNNLQSPKDKRIIVPDATLRALMNISEETVEVHCFYDLQKVINHHFKPPAADVVLP